MQILKGHKRVVHAVAFSPDGRSLASGSGDRTVRWWDLATGEPRATWTNHGVMGNKVAFSPNGRWLAAVCNHQVRIYDLTSGQEAHVLGENVPSGSVQALAFLPDGKRFVAGGVGGRWRSWRWWDPTEWKELPGPEVAAQVEYVCNFAFSPGGQLLAILGFGKMLLYNLKDGKVLDSWTVETVGTVPILPLAFSPDGRFLVFGHASLLRVWDVRSKQAVAELRLVKKHFQDAAFAPHSGILATVSNEETVIYWDTATWKQQRTFGWEVGKLKCVTFDPEGMRAAAGGDKGKIIVWDVD